MKTESRFLEPALLNELIGSRGQEWIRFGSDDLSPELDVAPESIQFETSTGGFELFAKDEVVDLFEEPDSLAVLYLTQGELSRRTQRTGNLSYKFSREKIVEIFVMVSEIRQTVDEIPTFKFTSHDGIVFQLENGWVGFSKEGMWEEDVHISTGGQLNELDLYNAMDDWESNLEVRYSGSTQLVELSSWLNDLGQT